MKWLRRIRGAIGMGLVWAAGWALAGLLIGVSSILLPGLPWHVFFEVFDAPLPALAIPGFVGGAIFSIVLGLAARRRRFEELSLPQFAAWGAVGGLMLILIPATALLEGADARLWRSIAVIAGPFVLLSATSACASLMLARRAQDRKSHEAGEDVAAARGARGLPGRGAWPLHEHPAGPGDRVRANPATTRNDAEG